MSNNDNSVIINTFSDFLDFVASSFWALLVHLTNGLFLGLLPVLIIAMLIGAVLRLSFAKDAGSIDRNIIYAFAIVGAVSGLIIGTSREPITHVALPGLLTLVSTFLAYVYAKEKPKTPDKSTTELLRTLIIDHKELPVQAIDSIKDLLGSVRYIPLGIIALCLTSIIGAFTGSSIRHYADIDETIEKQHMIAFENIEIPINRDLIRREAGLPLTPEKNETKKGEKDVDR